MIMPACIWTHSQFTGLDFGTLHLRNHRIAFEIEMIKLLMSIPFLPPIL